MELLFFIRSNVYVPTAIASSISICHWLKVQSVRRTSANPSTRAPEEELKDISVFDNPCVHLNPIERMSGHRSK